MEDRRIIVCVDELLVKIIEIFRRGYSYCEVSIDEEFTDESTGEFYPAELRVEMVDGNGLDRAEINGYPVEEVYEEELMKYGVHGVTNDEERVWVEKINVKAHFPPTWKLIQDTDDEHKVATLKQNKQDKDEEPGKGYEVYIRIKKTPMEPCDELDNDYDEDDEDDDYDYDDEYDEE